MAERPALSYSAHEVRTADPDRFLTALFAPPERREHLFALYAFNAEVARTRDQVSEPLMGHIRLQWWRDRLGEIYAGETLTGAVTAEALAAAIRAHDLPRGPFDRLLDAREQDLDPTPPETMAALEAYADDTAGGVAALAARLLGAGDDASQRAAHAVGTAWGLMGQLRRLAAGPAPARVMLPADLMAEQGIHPGRLVSGEGLTAIGAAIAATIVEHLRDARRERRAVAKPALPALLPASLIDLHLGRLDRHGYDVLKGSLEVARPRKQLRLLRFALRGRY